MRMSAGDESMRIARCWRPNRCAFVRCCRLFPATPGGDRVYTEGMSFPARYKSELLQAIDSIDLDAVESAIEVLRKERDARRSQRVMPTAARVEDAFNFAKHDAVTRGKKDVDSESLFIGLLHEAGLPVAMLGLAGVDLKKLREPIRDRIDSLMVVVPEEMTANPEVASILMDARMLAEERKEEYLTPLHVFYALVNRASASVLQLLEAGGGTREKVLASIESVLPPLEHPTA